MTRPLRHSRSEIQNAARIAKEMGMTVRLEADGAITLIPESDTGVDYNNGPVKSLEAWRNRNARQSTGRP